MQPPLSETTLRLTTPLGVEPIAVTQRSRGDHPFVAWHGITSVNRFWVWDDLWAQGAVWLAGLPGHGELPPLAREQVLRWTPDHFVDVGIETLRSLGGGRPATLIGHSTGGMVALGVAQRAPELVARVILLSPVVWSELTGVVGLWQKLARRPALLRAAIGATLGPGRRSFRALHWGMRAFIADADGFYRNTRVRPVLRDGYASMRRTSLDAYVGTTRVLRQADMRPLVLARPPAQPFLIVHGDRDPIIPLAQAQWLAGHLPSATLEVVPGTGHLPFAEREADVTARILAWLAQHPVRTEPPLVSS